MCDGTDMSPLGYFSLVYSLDKEWMHVRGKCSEFLSPLVPKEARIRSGDAFAGLVWF